MIALVQRVAKASVSSAGNPDRIEAIGRGLLVLLGVGRDDGQTDLDKIAAKLVKLRIFADENGKMNLDIVTAQGELLLVSQFTLLADTTGGNRPSFTPAADPKPAKELYERLARRLSQAGIAVKTGFFGAHMTIETILDGPVTIYLDSKKL